MQMNTTQTTKLKTPEQLDRAQAIVASFRAVLLGARKPKQPQDKVVKFAPKTGFADSYRPAAYKYNENGESKIYSSSRIIEDEAAKRHIQSCKNRRVYQYLQGECHA